MRQDKKNTPRYILTCIGPKIAPPFFEALSRFLSEKKITQERTTELANGDVCCSEMALVSEQPIDPVALTKACSPLKESFGMDLIVQEEAAFALGKRLVVFDLDSTLIQAEVIDELAKEAGVGEKVALITHRAMNGELSFPESLRERVGLLKGLPVGVLDHVYQRIAFTPGAAHLTAALRENGVKTAVLTGGFDYFAARFQKTLKMDYSFANRLEIENDQLTGNVSGEIVDGNKKAFFLEKIAIDEGIPLNQVVAIGDGANDLPMMMKAGLGIAFNAKPSVQKAAPYSMTQKSLTSILYLLGIPPKKGV
jgi:phosphoserine phosphatase